MDTWRPAGRTISQDIDVYNHNNIEHTINVLHSSSRLTCVKQTYTVLKLPTSQLDVHMSQGFTEDQDKEKDKDSQDH